MLSAADSLLIVRRYVVCNAHNVVTTVVLTSCTSVHVKATVRDLYARKDVGNFTGSFTGAVPTHGALALKITPLRCACPPGCLCGLPGC